MEGKEEWRGSRSTAREGTGDGTQVWMGEDGYSKQQDGRGRRDARRKESVEGPTRKIVRECPVNEQTGGHVRAWVDG